MTPSQRILVIGAGELGYQVLRFLAEHPERQDTTVSVLLRPGNLSPESPRKTTVDSLRKLGIHIVTGDIVTDPEQTLISTFEPYDTIISCMGFASGSGTQIKLTRAVLSAGIKQYIPWQFGVDYDAIGRGSAQDVFDEQLDVRDLLRSQTKTSWAIISTGMFTSFLFEPSFGVVNIKDATICALGSWQNRVTVTTPQDIGKITAEIVLGQERASLFTNQAIFIGGDTISYGELAELVEKITRKPFRRTLLTVGDAQNALAQDPVNTLLKYQIVFGQGRGVSWELSETWNEQRGIHALTAAEWAEDNIV
ncbi:hypothetical protein BDV59DRAFT_174509 [Aspergillus ambiguus]|uniref:aromatic alcohol reductase n=1 Tax=Aspergillus ambiguus TaxID=176160 RepID=UPI003CCCFC31